MASLAPDAASGGASRPALSRRRRWAALVVLAASLLVVMMDVTILNVALPELVRDLGPSTRAQLWIVDVYSIVLAGLLIPVSTLADRWGRRRFLIAGFAIFGLASLLVVVADSSGAVIAVRALLGVGGAMIMPTTMSLIRTLFHDPTERALALGVWAAMASVGAVAGPVVGGALLEHFSWHAAFLVNVPIMVLAVAGAIHLLPESTSLSPARLDPVGVALSIAGMVAVVYAVKETATHGPTTVGLTLAGVGIVALVSFVRRCLVTPDPMVDMRLFLDRPFSAGVLAAAASTAVIMALLLVAAQWMQFVRGWSPLETGAALTPLAVGGLVGSPAAPLLAGLVGVRLVMVGGMGLMGLGAGLLVALPQPFPTAGLLAVMLVVGLGTSSLGVGSALVLGRAPADRAGSVAAVQEIAYEVGAVAGIAVIGSVAAAWYRAGLPADAPQAARESVAGALGTSGAEAAMDAYTHAFVTTGLVCAGVMAVTCVVLWRWVPATLQISDAHH